jgi:NosR/NirI family nitrous oxide reductase transcriptional regulator
MSLTPDYPEFLTLPLYEAMAYSELTPNSGPVAYVFESIDLAPIPGFEGTPFNLLIAIDAQGNFISVEVLRQHEPVFLSGLGMGPLNDFVAQYTGKNIKQRITISNVYGERNRVNTDSGRVVLDGVTKATASIHIVNQTVLASALAVARVQLGLSTPGERIPAEVRSDIFEKKDFATLLKDGDIVHRRWTNAEVEALFSNSEGSGLDPIALSEPGADFVDLYVAYLNAPTIGKALLGEAEYKKLIGRLSPGQSAYWIASSGRHALFDEDFVRGTVPARLTLSQDSVPLEARDADLELSRPAGAPDFTSMLILKTPDLSGLDPGRAISIGLDVVREKGQVYPTRFRHTLTLDYAPPTAYFIYPPTPLPAWLVTWGARWPELAAIGVALILLSVMLAKPRWISVNPRRMQAFPPELSRFHAYFHRLVRPGATLHRPTYRGGQNAGGGSGPRQLPLRSGFPAAHCLHADQLLCLGARHFLWLALPLRCPAGIPRPARPAPAHQVEAPAGQPRKGAGTRPLCVAFCPADRRRLRPATGRIDG